MPKKNSTGSHGVLNAEPHVHQRAREIQPYGTVTHAFHLELENPVRLEMTEQLNQLLADSMTLRDLYKKAHWQVVGPTFYQLHLLYDKHYKEQSELADRQFHISIAQATRNNAIVRIVENTWDLRYRSCLCLQMLERARDVRRRPLKDEHQEIIESLRTRDPKAARAAMQTHLGGLIENLLLTAELEAMEQTRERLAAKREEIALRAASAAR